MGVGSKFSSDVFPTRGLSKFVAWLAGRESPIVVDLGLAVGVNVTFLGQLLSCKLYVEDLLSRTEVWWPTPPDGQVDAGNKSEENDAEAKALARHTARRLGHATDSVDGVLCWDVFDYLDSDAANTLADEVTRVLKPGGVVFLCHWPQKRAVTEPVQYEIVDDRTLRFWAHGAARPQPSVRESRAFTKMFADLTVCNSFLLTSRMREVVFRKPPASASAD